MFSWGQLCICTSFTRAFKMLEIIPAGENSLIIYFDKKIDSNLLRRISYYSETITKELNKYVIELIPSYVSIFISFNLNLISQFELIQKLERILTKKININDDRDIPLFEIPVYYGVDVGLDLKDVLQKKKMELDQFISIHSQIEYEIFAIGFAPNFAFLGQISNDIRVPRLKTPRISVPAGSVGIADSQTGVYPINSPGGWNLVGKTPLDLSISNNEISKNLRVGAKVRFKPISRKEFVAQGGSL